MKNRSLSLCGIALLYLFFSAFFVSCQKDPVAPVDQVTSPEEEQSIILDPGSIQDEISGSTTDDFSGTNPGDLSASTLTNTSVSALSTYVRKNLRFTYTSEPSYALTTLKAYSTTAWATLAKYTSYSIQRSSAYKRSGSYSTRYELRKTDGDVAGSKRTEALRISKDETTPYVERWYGVSYYLPSDYVYDAAPEIVTQWHTTSGGNPPLAVYTQYGQWRIVQFGSVATPLGNYERGKWTDFVFHVKWNYGSGGLIEVWKNGVKVCTKYGKNIYSGLSYGAYMRTGIYKWPWKYSSSYNSSTTKRIMYVDDVRIGNSYATYNDVAPGAY
jgi:hypothetical protein